MSGIVALDIVIGLLFIFLLYSLLATVVSEIIATVLGLRARNLKEAVDRMLNDEKEMNFLSRLWDSLRLMKNPKNKVIKAFYDQPEIKYLGSSGVFRAPSYFQSASFAKTLLNLLFGNKQAEKDEIDQKLRSWLDLSKEKGNADGDLLPVGPETAEYIYSLWLEANKDVAVFRQLLEGWFDRTMRQATEWYRRKIQSVLLILGFCLAWFFNADTFVIVKNLSVDKDAREELVSMANAYLESQPALMTIMPISDSSSFEETRQKLDSLLEVKKLLEADIKRSGQLLGTGGWPSDDVSDEGSGLTFLQKIGYMLRLAYQHFFGYLIMAIAISLGAPFWFDLLNKLSRIRTPSKENKINVKPE